MRYYNIASDNGRWGRVNLSEVEPLFTLLIGTIVLQNLVDGKVSDKLIKPSLQPCERYWIKAKLNFDGGYPLKGGQLIEIGADGDIDTLQAIVVKDDLSLDSDRDLISKYQLTSMRGDNHIRERLVHFFDRGEDRDLLKEKVFPGYRSDS